MNRKVPNFINEYNRLFGESNRNLLSEAPTLDDQGNQISRSDSTLGGAGQIQSEPQPANQFEDGLELLAKMRAQVKAIHKEIVAPFEEVEGQFDGGDDEAHVTQIGRYFGTIYTSIENAEKYLRKRA